MRPGMRKTCWGEQVNQEYAILKKQLGLVTPHLSRAFRHFYHPAQLVDGFKNEERSYESLEAAVPFGLSVWWERVDRIPAISAELSKYLPCYTCVRGQPGLGRCHPDILHPCTLKQG